jgi:signal peptidase I
MSESSEPSEPIGAEAYVPPAGAVSAGPDGAGTKPADAEPGREAAGEAPGEEADDGAGPADGGKGKKRQRPLSRELPVLIVVAIALALLLKAFVIQAFYIPSGSMEQTLHIQDRVLVNKVVYRYRDIHRGEIVVFNGSGTGFPQEVVPDRSNGIVRALRSIPRAVGLGQPAESDIIKRVIGVPGDTVACCDPQGRVTVNGVPLDEPYIFENSALVENGRIFPPTTVPSGQLFVLGDHRADSGDSRYSGFVPIDHVIGRAFVRVWPVSRFAFLRVPSTFSHVHAAGPFQLGLVGAPALLVTVPVLVRRRRRAQPERSHP